MKKTEKPKRLSLLKNDFINAHTTAVSLVSPPKLILWKIYVYVNK